MTSKLSRREVLNLALASPLVAAIPSVGQAQAGQTKSLNQRAFAAAPSAVVPVGGDDTKQIELAKSGTAEFLTFDKRTVNVAANNAPSVKINLLPS